MITQENHVSLSRAADAIIEKPNTTKVCFVCTGNTCRSPMAQALYNYLSDKDSFAISYGLYPKEGEPISENAVLALQKRGIKSTPENPYINHKAHSIDEFVLESCDKIIGITEAHTLELIGRFPALATKIISMPSSISDPYGGDLKRYIDCITEIEKGLKELFFFEHKDT